MLHTTINLNARKWSLIFFLEGGGGGGGGRIMFFLAASFSIGVVFEGRRSTRVRPVHGGASVEIFDHIVLKLFWSFELLRGRGSSVGRARVSW